MTLKIFSIIIFAKIIHNFLVNYKSNSLFENIKSVIYNINKSTDII